MRRNNNRVHNAIQDLQIQEIKADISALRESYKTLNDHSSEMAESISRLKTDIDWLKWAVRGVLFGIVVSVALSIITIVIK